MTQWFRRLMENRLIVLIEIEENEEFKEIYSDYWNSLKEHK